MPTWMQTITRKELALRYGRRTRCRNIEILSEAKMRPSLTPGERVARDGYLAHHTGLENVAHIEAISHLGQTSHYPLGCVAVCRAAEEFGEAAEDVTHFRHHVRPGQELIAYAIRDRHWDDPTVEVRCVGGALSSRDMLFTIRALRIETPIPSPHEEKVRK